MYEYINIWAVYFVVCFMRSIVSLSFWSSVYYSECILCVYSHRHTNVILSFRQVSYHYQWFFGPDLGPKFGPSPNLNFLYIFPIQNFGKKIARYFFYGMLSCILFLHLTKLAFICCNIIKQWEFPKILVLSLIFPILRTPAPVPKYWKKNTDYLHV